MTAVRRATLLAFGVLLGVAVSGCEGRECVRGHWQAMVVGKVITQQWFCDEYATGERAS